MSSPISTSSSSSPTESEKSKSSSNRAEKHAETTGMPADIEREDFLLPDDSERAPVPRSHNDDMNDDVSELESDNEDTGGLLLEDDDDDDELSEPRSSPIRDLGLDLSDSESQFALIGDLGTQRSDVSSEITTKEQENGSENALCPAGSPPPPLPPLPDGESAPETPLPPPPLDVGAEQRESASPQVPSKSPSGNRENGDDSLLGGDDMFDEDDDDPVMDDELFKMIEAAEAEENYQEEEEEKIVPRTEMKRRILIRKDKNDVEVLPKDWMAITHSAGVIVYLHRPSRVITLSRPYCIGPGSCKRHRIPLSAVPCLSYKRALEDEEQAKQEAEQLALTNGCPASNSLEIPPKPTVQSVEDVKKKALTPGEMHQYAQKLFKYETVKFMKFKYDKKINWNERRKFFQQAQKEKLKRAIEEQAQLDEAAAAASKNNSTSEEGQKRKATGDSFAGNEPRRKARRRDFNRADSSSSLPAGLPNGTQIISIPVLETKENGRGSVEGGKSVAGPYRVMQKGRKDWILNPHGKSNVCILHEYLQHSLKTQPVYEFEEVESSNTPYRATVLINQIKYGEALGSSKKIAKSEAAKETLKILIPQISEQLDANEKGQSSQPLKDLKYMDGIAVDDKNVPKLCDLMSEPCPYTVLVTCLQRNFGLGDTGIHNDLVPIPNSKLLRYTMRVNGRDVSVTCRNKKEGKQFAAQKMIKELLPQLTNWGSVLRMFGSHSIQSQKLKREKEAEVTSLQNRNSSRPAPSLAILDKLKKEMRLLHDMKRAMEKEPLEGKFVPPIDSDEVKPISNTCLDKVNL